MKKANWQRLEEVRMGMQYDVLQDPTKRVVAVRWVKRLAKKTGLQKVARALHFLLRQTKLKA